MTIRVSCVVVVVVVWMMNHVSFFSCFIWLPVTLSVVCALVTLVSLHIYMWSKTKTTNINTGNVEQLFDRCYIIWSFVVCTIIFIICWFLQYLDILLYLFCNKFWLFCHRQYDPHRRVVSLRSLQTHHSEVCMCTTLASVESLRYKTYVPRALYTTDN